MKKVWLTDQITSIGDYAFASCEVLEDLKIGNHLETIGGRAFHSCYGLKGQLNLPSSIQTIGESAFYDCTGLTTIYIDRPKDSVEGSPWNFPKGKVGILWKE
ncbi:leucine-rich repeat domain-containing protein [Coprococcus catus]|uniref:leucine-rich repeat domain-containing protein n=1 Tax=Coprococcus catus TaxID=116085 RepID=UPI003D07421B